MSRNNGEVEMLEVIMDKKSKKRKSLEMQSDLENSICLGLTNGSVEKKKKKKKKVEVETPVSESQVTKKIKKHKLEAMDNGVESPSKIKKIKNEERDAEASGLNKDKATKSKKMKKANEGTELKKEASGKSKKVKKVDSDQEASEQTPNKSKKAKKSKETIAFEEALLIPDIVKQGIVDTPGKKHKSRKSIIVTDIENISDPVGDYVPEDDEEDAHEDAEDLKQSKTSDIDFPLEDLPSLIENIESLLPTKENLSCKTRLKKMDWDKVAFNSHSAAQCKKAWDNILKKQRHYRYMTEILVDVKEWLEKVQNTHTNYSDFPKKKPLSGYMLYFVDQQNQVFKDRPDIKMVERSRLIADSYKQLSDNEKKKYSQLAAKNKAVYELEVQEFYKKHPHLRNSDTGKPPKKPITPLALYIEDHLNKVRLGEEEDASKDELKSRWKLLSDESKLVWIDKAVDSQINFVKDLKRYKSSHPDYSTSMRHILSKEEKQLLDKRNGKPDKPPTTAYMLFVKKCNKKYVSEIGDLTPKERLKVCSQKWQELTSDERRKYQSKLEALNEKFKIDNAAYLESLPDYERELEIKNTPKKLREDPLDKLKMADMATPHCWEEMKESEKNIYLTYITKIKKYFDTQHGLNHEDGEEETEEDEIDEQEEEEETD